MTSFRMSIKVVTKNALVSSFPSFRLIHSEADKKTEVAMQTWTQREICGDP